MRPVTSKMGGRCAKLTYRYDRADYLDRGLTPHLLALSKKGIRAKSMKPVFPVCWHLLSFPVGSLTILFADPDFPVSLLLKLNQLNESYTVNPIATIGH